MSKFTLTIKLGNAAMQTGQDVAGALADVVRDVIHWEDLSGMMRPIIDDNGNRVGEWEVTE